jgi:hypothetical protein
LSVDFQVVFPQQSIQLNSVRVLPGAVPPMLDIIGADFRTVSEVFINEVQSPLVAVISKTRLLAQLPAILNITNLASVSVISRDLTISPKSLIAFQIGPVAAKVSGILRLMQIFLKVLLTKPGRDIFAPRIGGAALQDLGLTFGADQGGTIVSDMIIAVSTTQRQILAIQSRDPTIPRDERLLSAVVSNASYDQAEGALIVGVELTSQAGRSATANIMV